MNSHQLPQTPSRSGAAVRVAIVHYHLRRGGVTRVIELARDALVAAGHEVLVLTGEEQPPAGRIPPSGVAVVRALRYGSGRLEAGELAAGVHSACNRRWGQEADVVHVHNHSLGKNLALPHACAQWATAGRALVLQMHDFAENGRPANYRYLKNASSGVATLALYPRGSRTVLAVLTSHAAAAFAAAGGSAEVLPNPIVLPSCGEPVGANALGAERLVVYPTRGIRRKNLGEFLLHAATAEAGTLHAVTAAPVGGQDLDSYLRWKELAKRLELPVLFDAAAATGRALIDFMRGADQCLTTSVEEGFGMAFLEPWAAGCALAGRDLPSVTRDFRESGLCLDALYPRWEIPERFLDKIHVTASTQKLVDAALQAYGLPPSAKAREQALRAVWGPGGADFGRLDEETQAGVLAAVKERGRPVRELGIPRMRTSALVPPETAEASSEIITQNQEILTRNFSLETYATRLESIYFRILNAPTGATEFMDAGRVLSAMLDFSDFSALRF